MNNRLPPDNSNHSILKLNGQVAVSSTPVASGFAPRSKEAPTCRGVIRSFPTAVRGDRALAARCAILGSRRRIKSVSQQWRALHDEQCQRLA